MHLEVLATVFDSAVSTKLRPVSRFFCSQNTCAVVSMWCDVCYCACGFLLTPNARAVDGLQLRRQQKKEPRILSLRCQDGQLC